MRTILLWILHITSISSTFVMWCGILSMVMNALLKKTLCRVPLVKNILGTKFFNCFCVAIVFMALVFFCRISSPYQDFLYH